MNCLKGGDNWSVMATIVTVGQCLPALLLPAALFTQKQQLQDYTAWVNNYLRRKPGVSLVNDLRWSLGDGVTFVHLVEIVGMLQTFL